MLWVRRMCFVDILENDDEYFHLLTQKRATYTVYMRCTVLYGNYSV